MTFPPPQKIRLPFFTTALKALFFGLKPCKQSCTLGLTNLLHPQMLICSIGGGDYVLANRALKLDLQR